MTLTIIHQDVPPGAPPDERDVLDEAAAVRAALEAAGHAVRVVPCGLNLQALVCHPAVRDADVVFNLVESLAGSGRLIHLAPAALESVGVVFTGNSSEAQFATSGKLLAKRLLRAASLPTADWVEAQDPATPERGRADWIVKSVWEHASVGLDDASVLRGVTAAAAQAVAAGRGGGWFAERYIEGREFNVGLIAAADGSVRTLPPAELVFVDYPPDKPRIIGYAAKWDETAFECAHTVRRFVDRAAEAALCARLDGLARDCWRVFGLSGYARVDFRVDADGQPWILEVNANPCLAPDAGFAAALDAAGIEYGAAIDGLAEEARRRGARGGAAAASPVVHGRPGGAASASAPAIRFRCNVRSEDAEAVRRIVASTGFFHADEVGVARELVEERLAKGEPSGYFFVFAELDGTVVGYSCFGPVPCTRSSYDLYWIAVDPAAQGGGVGRILLRETEAEVRRRGGTRLYAETSGRPQYAATRAFYERTGFDQAEVLADFYDVGDARVTYCKVLASCFQSS
jgi:D-alanine-D-alanine ligase-like ATP-grasp enzyme/ribosomal protein S18 acetylase RimI-like enzyme